MFRKLSEVPFEEWVARVFEQPVSEPEWYFLDAPENAEVLSWEEDQEPAVILSYLTRLFREAGERLADYSPKLVGQGLWYLASESGSGYMEALLNGDVSVEERRTCIASFYELHAGLFAPRCANVLARSYPQRTDSLQKEKRRLNLEINKLITKYFSVQATEKLPDMVERSQAWSAEREALAKRLESVTALGLDWDPYPLNSTCQMWWDILPLRFAPYDFMRADLDVAALDVMERTLGLDSMPCQEGALHGLGHWWSFCPERVEAIIDRYMERVRPEGALLEYAMEARAGGIL